MPRLAGTLNSDELGAKAQGSGPGRVTASHGGRPAHFRSPRHADNGRALAVRLVAHAPRHPERTENSSSTSRVGTTSRRQQ